MATTTNYGWTTPDDTALVKDGASAIRTLGSSVDTTTKNLNPETTLGDLAYRSSTANVKTRLGLGTAGQVLTVNSGADAPEWAAISAGGMTLISTTTLSGATTTLSSIPQTYNQLLIIVSGMTANTSDQSFNVLPNNSSSLIRFTGTSNAGAYSTDGTALDLSAGASTLRTNSSNAWQIQFFNYTSATAFKPFLVSGNYTRPDTGTNRMMGGGSFASTTAISSIVFNYGGSNTFSAGTVLLYGVK